MPIRRTIAGFDVLVFPGDKIDAKPILLLHGANGQPPDFLAFAQRLSNDGFIVYAPAVMGHALEHGLLVTVRNMLILRLSAQWPDGADPQRSPAVVNRLRPLTAAISAENSSKPIGVIGTCMTGMIPLALMSEPTVKAGVFCHPAIPFGKANRSRLGLSHEDWEAAVVRIQKKQLSTWGFRFGKDTLSPPQRLDTVRFLVRDQFHLDPVSLVESEKHEVFTVAHPPGSKEHIAAEAAYIRLKEGLIAVLK